MNKTRSRMISMAVSILIITQLACQTVVSQFVPPTVTATVPPSPVPTTIPAAATPVPTEAIPFSDEEIKAGIQQSLDIYADALTNNKPELLEKVVDQENKPFRRIVRSRFDDFQSSFQSGQVDFVFSVLEITRREHGFILARFKVNRHLEAQWMFRYLNDAWVISEPSVDQIGEPVITETDHFIFTTYPWADDVNPLIMELMEAARTNVEDVLGKVPDVKANVEIVPIYGLYPFNPMNAIASYSSGYTSEDDRIEIYSPNSFAYSYYDPKLGWDSELEQTLTHEFTHMTHFRSFNQAGKLADWMSEGLAEYVSGVAEDSSYWACDAMESGTFIPIMDETRTVYKQDLLHMYGLEENFGLSYDFAASLVLFTVEKHGGLDGFWELGNTFDKTSDFKEAVQESFGISYKEYDNQWQAWLKRKC